MLMIRSQLQASFSCTGYGLYSTLTNGAGRATAGTVDISMAPRTIDKVFDVRSLVRSG